MLSTFAPTKPKKKRKNQYTYKFINIKKNLQQKKNHNKTIKDIFHKILFLKEKEEKNYNNNKFQRKQNQNHRK